MANCQRMDGFISLLTIQRLLQEHFADLGARRRLSKEMWRAGHCLRACRTAELGGHVIRCPAGHQERIAYNSCRHRCCPQCCALPREAWLAGWRERLLDCAHFHVVFTTPHELVPIWRYNRKLFGDVLFAAATEALKLLLGDRQYLGARPGMLAALHTWSQTLAAHVPLHVLVTAGGYADGRWQVAKKRCLLPRKVLMIVFRGKLRAALLAAYAGGKLTLPPEMSERRFRSLLNRLGRRVWNVKILDRYEHGVGVATYLARYLKGGPISNRRLLRAERDGVRFRCRAPDGSSAKTTVRLNVAAFLIRLLQHVPPHAMRVIRGYGLYAGGQREPLNQARLMLGQTPLPKKRLPPPTWQELCERLGNLDQARCATCGATLIVEPCPRKGRPPPTAMTVANPPNRC